MRIEARGVLWELKEHPLWLAIGIVAIVVFVGAIVGLRLMSGAGRQSVALVPQAGSGEDHAQSTDPNERTPEAETSRTSRQETQTPSTASATPVDPNGSVAVAPVQPSQPPTDVRRPPALEDTGEMLPLWARIVLDGTLFPPAVTWSRAEGFFRSYSKSKPELLEKPEELQSATLFRPAHLGNLPLEALTRKYGEAVASEEAKMTWYSYGPLGFGVKSGEKHISEVRAPVRVFVNGFTKSAQQSGVAKPIAFFVPGAGGTSTATGQEPVTVVNMRAVAVQLLIGGAGPCSLDPGRKKTVRLPPAYYPLEVSSGNTAATSATVPAFPRARWEIVDDVEGTSSGCVRLAAERDPSRELTGTGMAHVKIVNGHDAPIRVQVGYDGRYYRLPPQGEVQIRVRTRTYIVCIEDGTRSAYQVVDASGSLIWSVAADQGLLPFRITAAEGPVIADGGIPVVSPAVIPVCPIDPNELAGRPRLLAGHGEAVSCVTFSPDGSRVLSAGRDNTLHLWDMTSQDANDQFDRTFRGGHVPATALAFGPDGQSAWSSDALGKEIICWNIDTGEELGGLMLRTCPASAVAFSHRSQKVLLGERTLSLWDLETGEMLQQWRLSHSASASDIITACDISPDDRYALCGDPNGQLTMIDMSEGSIIWRLKAHDGRINAVAFDPDGRLAVSASDDRTASIWDLKTQKETVRFEEHTMRVTAVAFAPGGKKALSGSSDKTIRLWDVESGKETACLEEHTGPVLCASFSPDGALVVSGSEDRTVRVWQAPEPTHVDAKPASEPKRMPNAAIIATTQVAPAIGGTESTWWVSSEGKLRVNQTSGKEFVWVQIRLSRAAKLDSYGFRLTDANDLGIGRLVTMIDSNAYRGIGFPAMAMRLDFVRGGGVQPDAATLGLLYDLAIGAMFRPMDHTILLIFDADHNSPTQYYLRDDDVREPLQLRPYKSGRSVLPRGGKAREPEPPPDGSRRRRSK